MKTIYNITKTELRVLFFSPVAWLILVVFTFQSALVFTDTLGMMVRRFLVSNQIWSGTAGLFSGPIGTFTTVQEYLFLYIPLLTMGCLSREYSSGSVKLLYSSPVTSRQIVLGKYLALVTYALVLTAILAVFALFGTASIVRADVCLILSGLFGLFLLACTYASIGLFMSSLTSYMVVSAMGTLAIFAALNYMRNMGQETEFIRDITFWLSIPGRTENFISGLVASEDLLYFLVVSAMFLGFTIVRMENSQQKKPWYVPVSKYVSVAAAGILLGYFSAKPTFMTYYDATATKTNTLTKSSQEVLKHLDQDMTITTYTNMLDEDFSWALPASYKIDVNRFKAYTRFKPQIRMKYKYYYERTDNKNLLERFPGFNSSQLYDTLKKLYDWRFDAVPYSAIRQEVNLDDEKYHFVRLLRLNNGKQTFLRLFDDVQKFPSEAEITAAFKRLVIEKSPTVGFVTGHGERRSNGNDDRGYNYLAREKSFRYALINQGFDFEDVQLDKPVPAHIRVLVIAEVRKPLAPAEMLNLQRYIDHGGNCIIAGEPGFQDFVNPLTKPMGVDFLTGTLVKPGEKFQPDLLFVKPTKAAEDFSFYFKNINRDGQILPLKTAAALRLAPAQGFSATILFASDSTRGWLEQQTTNFIDDTVTRDQREPEQAYPTIIALSRKINGQMQKILVMGDADCLSNGELMTTRNDVYPANFALIKGIFSWFTNGELPVDMRRTQPPDNALRISKQAWPWFNFSLKWLFPLLLAGIGTLLLIRRKSR